MRMIIGFCCSFNLGLILLLRFKFIRRELINYIGKLMDDLIFFYDDLVTDTNRISDCFCVEVESDAAVVNM